MTDFAGDGQLPDLGKPQEIFGNKNAELGAVYLRNRQKMT